MAITYKVNKPNNTTYQFTTILELSIDAIHYLNSLHNSYNSVVYLEIDKEKTPKDEFMFPNSDSPYYKEKQFLEEYNLIKTTIAPPFRLKTFITDLGKTLITKCKQHSKYYNNENN